MLTDKICVYAICKNESKFVEQWIENVSEADYVVVLDTGSTDDTYKKLKDDPRITKVVKKKIEPWRFDVARNESMKLIPDDATILISTDFDELLNPGWAQALKEGWTEDATRGFYDYAWSHNSVNEPTDIFIYDKIHTRDYEWVYPVHEVLMPKDPQHFTERGIRYSREEIFLQHYQDVSKSRGSYFDLLRMSVEEHPDDSHVQMLYAREFLLQGREQEALDEYLKVLTMTDVNEENKRLVLLESLGRVASIYVDLKNYDEAIWYAQEFIKEDYTYREPYIILAEVYNEMKMYTLADACIKAAHEYCTRKYDWVERADSWTNRLDDAASVADFNLGNIDKAIEEVTEALKHAPDDARLNKNYSVFLSRKLEILNAKVAILEAQQGMNN